MKSKAIEQAIVLPKLNIQTMTVRLEGDSPLICHAWSHKAKQEMLDDLQNAPFSMPAAWGAKEGLESRVVDYPFFVDVRAGGMAVDSPIVSDLPAVTLHWASPITLDWEKNAARRSTVLLRSSPESWEQADLDIRPDFDRYPSLGFPTGVERESYALAVSVEGVFESAFKDRPSPLQTATGVEPSQEPFPATIDVSAETARLVVVSSAEFVNDAVFEMSPRPFQDHHLNNLRLIQNAVAWSTEEADLLNLRARGTHTRMLAPMTENERTLCEVTNGLAILTGLVASGLVWREWRKNRQPAGSAPPGEVEA